MIDTIYQDGTNAALDDRVRRPLTAKPDDPGFSWAQLAKAPFQGLAGGALDVAAAKADEVAGFGQVSAAGGAFSGGGMFSLPTDAERAQNNAAHNKLMTQGVDMNSAEGDALRLKARDVMPDPQTTAASAQILAGVSSFAGQAVGAGMAGPAGLVNLGVDQALTESDRLRQQGVDFDTRTEAGAVQGLSAAGSLLLPMTGATRALRALKGAAGGVAATSGTAEAERLILQHGGYDKIGDQYDPLDPTSLALGALVPAAFGAAFGHPVKTDAEMHGAMALSPEDQAHSDAIEANDRAANIADLQKAVAAEKNPANKAVLQAELERVSALPEIDSGAAADPNLQAAARTKQTADALDASRLTPDDDLVGRDQHQAALEQAYDQMGRGEPVEISDMLDRDSAPTTFETSRGSQYLVNEDGTTTRNKAQRDDVGHEGDFGPQPPSDATFYVDAAGLQKLGEFQTQGAGAKSIVMSSDGRAAMRYEEGSNAGKMESRTLTDVQSQPAPGLYPVELFKGGRTVHFGNEITQVGGDARVAKTAAAVAEAFPRRDSSGLPMPPDNVQTPPNAASFEAAKAEVEQQRADAATANAETKAGEGAAKTAAGETKAPAHGAEPAKAVPGEPHVGVEPAHLDAAVGEILRANPDQMVQLDGMDHPVRAADLLEELRQQAADETRDSSLLEVAAQCAISL